MGPTSRHPGVFDGEGSGSLLRQVLVAEATGDLQLSLFLEPSSGVNLLIAQSNVEEVGGTLETSVHDGVWESFFEQRDRGPTEPQNPLWMSREAQK